MYKKYLFLLFFASWGLANHPSNVCQSLVRQYEQQHGIPKNLLQAISLVESGRKLPGQGIVAWPWTINANGTPYVFETKAEAIAKVKELQLKGIHLIDVGCMQINLKHHPDAFNSLEDAFDPEKNIAYATQFLLQKWKNQNHNWQKAVGDYHNINETIHKPYVDKVMSSLNQLGNDLPIQTVFTLNTQTDKHPGQLSRYGHTYFSGIRGRRIPIRVRFSPYANYGLAVNTRSQNGKLRSLTRTSHLLRKRQSIPLRMTSYRNKMNPQHVVTKRIVPHTMMNGSNAHSPTPSLENTTLTEKTLPKMISWPLVKKQKMAEAKSSGSIKNPGSLFPTG